MNYRNVYFKIISNAKEEVKNGLRPISKNKKKDFKNYFEFHHILPRSLFPLWKNKQENIVPLTGREHFFCHKLLTKIFPSIQMECAVWRFFTDKKHSFSSREYEIFKIKHSWTMAKLKKGSIPWNKGKINVYSDDQLSLMSRQRKAATTEETIKKIKIARAKQDMSWRHEWHPSEETRKRLSESHKGLTHSLEYKLKMKSIMEEKMQIIKNLYERYKENGGLLKWNEYQKALKNGEL